VGPQTDPWLDQLQASIWAKAEFSMVPIDYTPLPERAYAGPPPGDGLRIVFVGIPSDFGVAFLLHLLQRRANLHAVVGSSRWHRTHPKPDLLARIAGHAGLPVEVGDDLNAPAFVQSLRRYQPDLMVMASFDQILHDELLAIPRLGWMNVHPSLLPRHRGPEPIYWTIAQGDGRAGITLHWTVRAVDAGPILAQRALPVRDGETSGTLAKQLVALGSEALDETLARLATGDLRATPPNLSEGSYEPPVVRTELDWNQPHVALERLVRAGSPDQPPCFRYHGEDRYVLAIESAGPRTGETPGILSPLDGRMLAAASDTLVTVSWSPVGHQHAGRPRREPRFP